MIEVTVRHFRPYNYGVENCEDILLSKDKQVIDMGKRFQKLALESKILKAEGKISKAESKKLKIMHNILLADYHSSCIEEINSTSSEGKYFKLEENSNKIACKKMYAKAKYFESRSKHWEAYQLLYHAPKFAVGGVLFDEFKQKSYSRLIRLILKIKDYYDGTKYDEIIYKAESIKSTYSWFNGLWPVDSINLLVMVDSDLENHELAFHQVADYYEKELGLNIDRKNSKISDMCYYGYAPSVFINPKCVPFHVDLNIKSHEIYNEGKQSKKQEGIL